MLLSFSRAEITLTGGEELAEGRVLVRQDSVVYRARGTARGPGYEWGETLGPALHLHLSEIERIRVPSGSRGPEFALLGLGVGVGIGISVWGGDAWAWSLLFFGLPGMGIGALVGSGVDRWETIYDGGRETRWHNE